MVLEFSEIQLNKAAVLGERNPEFRKDYRGTKMHRRSGRQLKLAREDTDS